MVVKAKHKESGDTYAVKIVDKNSTGRQEMFDEINVMSKLAHPNIVNFKEIFDRKDGYYVVLELCVPFSFWPRHFPNALAPWPLASAYPAPFPTF